MSRGKKLDIFIGADIDDGWAQVQTPRKSKVSNEILEPSKHFLVFSKEKILINTLYEYTILKQYIKIK